MGISQAHTWSGSTLGRGRAARARSWRWEGEAWWSREMDAGSATSWLHVLGERDLLSLCVSFLICKMGAIVTNSENGCRTQ